MSKKVLVGLGALCAVAAAIVVVRIGPGNIIGMIRYDQRQKGKLRVGDRAPDVGLVALDGKTPVRLSQFLTGRPCVVIFGSFT